MTARGTLAACAALLAGLAGNAAAAVTTSSDAGFVIEQRVIVRTGPDTTWDALRHPERWWNAAQTWSGSAANLSLDATPGGCFCERWPGGGSELAHVVLLREGVQLRMRGSFGPLQALAAGGIADVLLTPGKDGTQVDLRYRVSGSPGDGLDKLAEPTDGMLAAQLAALKALLDREADEARAISEGKRGGNAG